MTIEPYSFIWKMEEQAFFNRDSAAIYFARYQTYLERAPVRHNKE